MKTLKNQSIIVLTKESISPFNSIKDKFTIGNTLPKSVFYNLMLLIFSILILMPITSNLLVNSSCKTNDNSRCVRAVKYHGQIIPSVTLPVINIVAEGSALPSARSNNQVNRAEDVIYRGKMISSINLPEIEIVAKRKL